MEIGRNSRPLRNLPNNYNYPRNIPVKTTSNICNNVTKQRHASKSDKAAEKLQTMKSDDIENIDPNLDFFEIIFGKTHKMQSELDMLYTTAETKCDKKNSHEKSTKRVIPKHGDNKPNNVDILELLDINVKDFENDIFNDFTESFSSESKNAIQHFAQDESPDLFTSSSAESNSEARNDNFKVLTQNKLRRVSSSKENGFQSQFSQIFNSSQVVKQLDEAISLGEEITRKRHSREILEDNFSMPSISRLKRHSLDKLETQAKIQKTDSIGSSKESVPTSLKVKSSEGEVGCSFNNIKNRNELSQFFNNLEQSISHFGEEHKRDEVLGTDWADDSFLIEGLTQATTKESIQDVIRRVLQENAAKAVQPQQLVNRTITNTEPVFQNLGPFFGLPDKVRELIKAYKGIDRLYDWQQECLNLPAVNQRKNLIYSLPTSGGKTLVAEVLILREIVCRRRNAIFVLPYVAIVQEKVWALSPFAVALDFLVEEYAAGKGTYPPKKRRYKNSVYIATTEKALGLINSLVEQGRLEEIGLVVIDELHLIGEEKRGAVLETLLTKLMHLNENIQIIGMSATIGNLADIQRFLKAVIYTRNFRPVELTEYVKCGDQIMKVNSSADNEHVFELVRTSNFNYSQAVIKVDPDHLAGLVMEVIPKGSCLIFCPSKKGCENVARLLYNILKSTHLKEYKKDEKQQLVRALRNDAETLCNILEVSVQLGIAYHHSGLTSEERKLIEEAYRAEVLSVICCTSTLAAGVNLPAKRVIIRKPYIAKEFINLSRYKQMIGRAGRAGFGEIGESIMICESKDMQRVANLLVSPMDQTLSKMHNNDGSCLRHLFLSCISLGTAMTKAQLEVVANKTLLAVQQKKLNVDMKELIRKVVSDLFIFGAVQLYDPKKDTKSASVSSSDVSVYMDSSDAPSSSSSNVSIENQSGSSEGRKKTKKRLILQNNDKLVVSKLGNAAIKGCLDLTKAHMLYEDLQKAQESLVLVDCLHLLYLVTPYNMVEQMKLEKPHFHSIMNNLDERKRKTAAALGITEFIIVRLYSHQNVKGVDERILNRFYIALMLYDLWNEVAVIEVSEKYQVNRGIVQNLMTNAAAFAANVVSFCEQLEEFWAFAHLLKGMSQRLAHCCRRELLPLMELPAVKQSRARQLYGAGFKTLQSIAKADPDDLIHAIEYMSGRLAKQLIAAAKLLLLEKVETLREEAEDVLDGVVHSKQMFNQSLFR